MHTSPSCPVVPGGQAWVQSLSEVLPGALVLPAGQSWQTLSSVAALAIEYLPLAHLVHTTCAVALAYLPASQSRQVSADVAETTDECFPASQLSHCDELELTANVPA